MATQAKVDQVGKRPLPLPPAPPLVADNSELSRSWSSVKLLFADYLRAKDQQAKDTALRHYGIFILLTVHVILKGLKHLSSQHDSSSPDGLLILASMKRVAEAGK